MSNPEKPKAPLQHEFIPFGGEIGVEEVIQKIPIHISPKAASNSAPVHRTNSRYRMENAERVRYWQWKRPEASEEPKIFDSNAGENGQKRARGEEIEGAHGSRPQPKKPKKFNLNGKNAISLVNEIYPSLQYEFSDYPNPNPDSKEQLFRATVVYTPTGKQFEGFGRSKKSAKNNAAELILLDLRLPIPEREETPLRKVQFIPPTIPTEQANPESIDFASDDIALVSDFDLRTNAATFHYRSTIVNRLKNIPNLNEQSLLAVHQVIEPHKIQFDFFEDGPPHLKSFTANLHYETKVFVGYGSTKKKAKTEAARQCILGLIGLEEYRKLCYLSSTDPHGPSDMITGQEQIFSYDCDVDVPMNFEFENDNYQNEKHEEPMSEYDQEFINGIAKMIQDKFQDIMKDDQAHVSQKVLAGVIMTQGESKIENCQVLAVSTGTKCIEGNYMSTTGSALNDCHAEILSTRCVRDFLYSEMEALRKADNFFAAHPLRDSIFEYVEADSLRKFKLKKDVRFHLYISTAPCGDARIFSPKGLEHEDPSTENPHPNRSNRGVLRAKIESGEGTIPVANLAPGPQTWDGILQGNALNTMSCSDKVCRWNILGFQGALLSLLTEPIYYSTITLGSLFHPVHFTRAMCGRIEPLKDSIDLPFRINSPELMMVDIEAKRQVKKSPNHAVAWTKGWSTHETIVASKGRCHEGDLPSRLTKRLLYQRFLMIYKNDRGRKNEALDISYNEAKQRAIQYQIAKKKFFDLMKDSKFGCWISKPVEQDSFFLQN